MLSAINKLACAKGQGTVEAAIVIPILFTCVLLLLQPAIVFYDQIVMKSAASEACRLVSELGSGSTSNVEDYIRRRLSAIPQVDAFHVHSQACSYDISIEGANEAMATVTIKNKIKLLPLIDVAYHAFGRTGADGTIEIMATSTQISQPEWVWK